MKAAIRDLSLREFAIAAALVAVLTAIATGGLHSVTEQWNFTVPVAIGAIAALLVGIGSRWQNLMIGETVAAAAVVFVIVGALVAGGGVPGPQGFESFFTGLTEGWAELLSSTPPTDMTPELRVVPLTSAFVGTTIGIEVLRRLSQPGLPIIGPLGVLALTILFTEFDRGLCITIGALLAAGALGVGFIQQRALRSQATKDYIAGSTRSRRTAATVGTVLVVAAAAPLLGPVLPVAGEHDRYGLRDDVVPPWDPLALPSPLTQLKKVLTDKEEAEEQDQELPVVFRVTSDDQPTRFASAVLGDYDGTVFTVGSGAGDAAAEFRPVGSRMPDPADEIGGNVEVEAQVEIVDLAGPWIPSPGWPSSLDIVRPQLEPDDADVVVRENVVTGTLAIPAGLPDGTTYEISARLPDTMSDEQLAEMAMRPSNVDLDLTLLGEQFKSYAGDVLEGQDAGWDEMAAIREQLLKGYYETGEDARPGHSLYRIAEFLEEPDFVVGYEEQYAAAGALLGRFAGLATRVVVGYEIEEGRYEDGVADVRQSDLTAWVEARVDGVGWVVVDLTPDTTAPDVKPPQQEPQETPAPNPPPPPPPPPQLDVAPDNREEEEEEEEEEDKEYAPLGAQFPGPPIRGYVAAGAGGVGGVIVLLAALVVGVKAWRTFRRRRQRDPARRIAGAWHELADRYHEAGVPIPTKSTPLEAARAYLTTERSAPVVYAQLRGLVRHVDRSAWHYSPPDAESADQSWEYCDVVLTTLAKDRSLLQRIRMRLDPRPLWHRDVWRRAVKGSGQ